jgi:hypothetical protein
MTNSNDRYCSNVVAVTLNNVIANDYTIDNKTKVKVDRILNNFYSNIESKYSSNDRKIKILNSIILSLKKFKLQRNSLASIVDYMIRELEKRKAIY